MKTTVIRNALMLGLLCWAVVVTLALADEGLAQNYGPAYQGQPLGCAGAGLYDTTNVGIVAVGPSDALSWPCYTVLLVCGEYGCVTAQRLDYCPACHPGVIDMSEAGLVAVCGSLRRCPVQINLPTPGPVYEGGQ